MKGGDAKWAGFARLTHQQQNAYLRLDPWQQALARYQFECRWNAEQARVGREWTAWQNWMIATRELLRWYWSLVA